MRIHSQLLAYTIAVLCLLSCNNDSKLSLFSAEKDEEKLITQLTINTQNRSALERTLPSIHKVDSLNMFYLQADSLGIETLNWQAVEGVTYEPESGSPFDFRKTPNHIVTVTYTETNKVVSYQIIGQRKAISNLETTPNAYVGLKKDAIEILQQEGIDYSDIQLRYELPYKAIASPATGTKINLLDSQKDTLEVTFLDKTQRVYPIRLIAQQVKQVNDITEIKSTTGLAVSRKGQDLKLMNTRDTELNKVKIRWNLPAEAKAQPISGSTFNFADNIRDSIVVNFKDNTRKVYYIEPYFTPNGNKELLNVRFEIDRVAYYGKLVGDTWTVEVPASTDLTRLPTPELQISEKATHDKPNQTDFSTEVAYTITAEDGSTKLYKVNVVKEKAFRTKWNMNSTKTLALPIYNGGTYNFEVDWGDGTAKQQVTSWNDADATHTYAANGVYTVTIKGTIDGFSFKQKSTSAKALSDILAWGDLKFGNVGGYLKGTKGLTVISAADVPSMQGTTDLSEMFSESAVSRITNLDSWDVSKVTNMNSVFYDAEKFNQPLEKWDVSKVTNMSQMFYRAEKFNQPLGRWNVSKVTDMSYMFYAAVLFNQPLNDWNVSNVTNMGQMFFGVDEFNQPLDKWDVSKVTTMEALFFSHTRKGKFNQNINAWNVGNVKDFRDMFSGQINFNQPLDKWDLTQATAINAMFNGAASFNQPLESWNISKVTSLNSLFYNAVKFNQPLDKWDVSKVGSFRSTFENASSFNQKLCNWKIKSGADMGDFSTGAGVNPLDCPKPFRTKWNMNSTKTLALPIYNGGTYNFEVDWGDGTAKQQVTSWNDADATHTYSSNGTYTVTITGTIEGFSFLVNSQKNSDDLVDIMSWGSLKLGNKGGYFNYTRRLTSISATDVLNLEGTTNLQNMFNISAVATINNIHKWDVSKVTNMSGLFSGAQLFDQALDKWDVSKVTDMSNMFAQAYKFNHSLNGWNVANVTDMSSMFYEATAFDQPLDKWNVAKVTDMGSMFYEATAFDQPLDKWNVGNVTRMSGMFEGTAVFNRSLNDWDVSKVVSMSSMFKNTKKFNQPLGNWNVGNITHMSGMFKGSQQYNQPLDKWNVSKVTDMSDMFMNAKQFNQPLKSWNTSAVTAMTKMFEGAVVFNQSLNDWDVSKVVSMLSMFKNATAYTHKLCSWKIKSGANINDFATGAGVNPLDCPKPFVTKWDMSTDKVLTLPLYNGGTYNFAVDWGDGTAKQQVTSWNDADAVHTYATNGTYTVTITGTINGFSTLKLNQDRSINIAPKLIDIISWGIVKFGNVGGNLTFTKLSNVTATDMPDLTGVTNLFALFANSSVRLVPNIEKWDVSKVTNMSYTFYNTSEFNQSINDWNTGSVTSMEYMFGSTVKFNQPIDKWDVSKVTDMSSMFRGAKVFNQSLNSWITTSLTNIRDMFKEAPLYNQPLDKWDVSKVTNMIGVFLEAVSFNQPLDKWDVSKVTSLNTLFYSAVKFNQNLGSWNVSKVTDMDMMFHNAKSFDQDLSTWKPCLISSEPTAFSTNTVRVVKPVWGTCP